jgi:hypothetical protein
LYQRELFVRMAVVEVIPERGGIGVQPQSAASNDQISLSPGHIRPVGNGGCRFARLCSSGESERVSRLGQGRPARNPIGCPKLLTTGLAELRDVLPAHGPVNSDDSGSSIGHGAALKRTGAFAVAVGNLHVEFDRELVARTEASQTDGKTFMASPVLRNDSPTERECSAAIREEIGDRLRINLAREPDELLPERMMMLVDQMAAEQPLMLRLNRKIEATK